MKHPNVYNLAQTAYMAVIRNYYPATDTTRFWDNLAPNEKSFWVQAMEVALATLPEPTPPPTYPTREELAEAIHRALKDDQTVSYVVLRGDPFYAAKAAGVALAALGVTPPAPSVDEQVIDHATTFLQEQGIELLSVYNDPHEEDHVVFHVAGPFGPVLRDALETYLDDHADDGYTYIYEVEGSTTTIEVYF